MKRAFIFLMGFGGVLAEEFPEIYNSETEKDGEPMKAEEAAKAFEVPEGFGVTVFAAEPEVQNPIAMTWDHKGRMWVAENYTYAEKGKRFDLELRDRVVIFEDEDRDGKAEKRTVFSDKLQMLTSVEVQPGGVWVMCPPQLLFIADKDGDDVPDGEPEVVLDGFTVAESNYHNFANGLRWGPDGALYGLDWSDTGECHDHTGVHRTSGRIYRFSYGEVEVFEMPYQVLGGSNRMREFFQTKNPWIMRQILVIARLSRGDASLFNRQVLKGGDVRQRLRMLWLMNALGEVDRKVLLHLLRDQNEQMRVWAIRLLTDGWAIDSVYGPMEHRKVESDPELRDRFVEMAKEDESGLVRLALASTLQRIAVEDRVVLASALAGRGEDAKDHNLPKLVWFGLMHLGAERLEVAKVTEWPDLLRYLARSAAADVGLVDKVVSLAAQEEGKSEALLIGLMEGFKGWRKAPMPRGWDKVSKVLEVRHPKVTRELSALFGDGRAMGALKEIALDGEEYVQVRKRALEALVDGEVEGLRGLCEKLLRTRGLGATAVKGLAKFDDPEVGKLLVENYRKLRQSDEKAAVIDTLVTRKAWVDLLLGEVEKGKISRKAVTPFHGRQILAMEDEGLSEKLSEVWGEIRKSDEALQAKIVSLEKMLSAEVRGQSDKVKGRVHFQTLCASCHQLYGEGGKLGPDLTGSGRADLGYLLENIVAPNSVVPAEYQMSIVTMKDGRILSGVVSSENKRTLTLQTLAEEVSLEKGEIRERKRLADSMMPPGLIDGLSEEEIRDLVGYLMHPKQVELPK